MFNVAFLFNSLKSSSQEPSWPMLRFAQNRVFAAWEVMSPTPKAFCCWIPVDIISDLWNSHLSLAGDGDGILEGW